MLHIHHEQRTPLTVVNRHRTFHLRSSPCEAHLCAVASMGRVGGQARGTGELWPSGSPKVRDLNDVTNQYRDDWP